MLRCFASLGLASLGATLALSSPLLALDTPGAGWGTDTVRPLTFATTFGVHDTLTNGNRVVFDGSLAWVEQDDGTFLYLLGGTPAPTFASFAEVDPSETFALLGESSNGVIYRVALTGVGGLVPLATLGLNYDLAFEPGGATALVSAGTCVAGCSNEIHRVDVTTGATTLIAAVSGPSGPIAVSAAGDLIYGTQPNAFPTPPGSVDLIRWTAAQITNGPFPLSAAQASVFVPALDGAGSMAFDPQYGHLFLSEPAGSGVTRILEIDPSGAIVGPVVTSLEYLSEVEVFDAPGAGVLAAFQPAGAQLAYKATEFIQGTATVARVSPRRPQLAAVQNGDGTMTVSLAGATPGTSCFVISSSSALYNPVESAIDIGPYLLWTGMPLGNIRRAGIQFNADSNGDGAFTFRNPPPIQGTRVIQVLVRDAQGVFRGSSTAVTN